MTVPKELTTVTPLSKTLAMIAFITLPFIAFFAGINYERSTAQSYMPVPTDMPLLSPTTSASALISPVTQISPSPKDNRKSYEETTSVPGQVRFVSPKLGISFLYLSTYANQKVHTKVVGTRIYVYAENTSYDQGQYVDVMVKRADQALKDMVKNMLMGNELTGCVVQQDDYNYKFYPNNYEAVKIVPTKSTDPNDSPLAGSQRCPSKYAAIGGNAFFLGDKNHPDKFLFFSIGQYAITADNQPSNERNWQNTVQFLN